MSKLFGIYMQNFISWIFCSQIALLRVLQIFLCCGCCFGSASIKRSSSEILLSWCLLNRLSYRSIILRTQLLIVALGLSHIKGQHESLQSR